MTLDADVIILGGGCAGLSLATALAGRAPHLRVLTLESRSAYSRDRTWCFWAKEQHPFAAAVTHRWHSWRVRNGGDGARQQSRCYSYQHLPADHFYELTQQKIRHAGQELALGVSVHSINSSEAGCEVETSEGSLRSQWIFDSRPQDRTRLKPVLEQRFTGWHVHTDSPCFDPSTVDLMDFQASTDHGRTMFFYVLPFSATEALVEATYLDVPGLAYADAEGAIRRYLEPLAGQNYRVLYRESGVLPMGNHRSHASSQGRVVDIGIRGGRVKASSGYAFQRIQRQSAAFANALAQRRPLPSRVEPLFYGVLDEIFLRALQRSPDRAASYFLTLFRKLPPDALVRFLSETAPPGEVLRAMLALPPSDFLRAAVMRPLHGGGA